MPFYARPLLPKNQSALALGMFRRADRPPAFHQRHPDFWEGWCGRVDGCEAQGGCACCAVRGSKWVAGWSECEAQGGCACCAVRGSKWVAGWMGVRHRAAAPAVLSGRAMVRRALEEMVRY